MAGKQQAPGREAGPGKTLVATSLAPSKAYSLAFLRDVLGSLQGADTFYVGLDGFAMPDGPEMPAQAVLDPLPPLPPGSGGFYRFARVREAARQYFLKGDWTHLFFLDADIIPPVDIVPRLVSLATATGAEIATGLYCARGLSEPVIYVVTATGNMPAMEGSGGAVLAEQLGGRAPLGGYIAGENTPSADQMQIMASGMGCMLISRAALEAVSFREAAYFERPDCNGEDIQFCLDVHEKFGTPAVLDLSLVCWHVHVDGKAYRVKIGEPQVGCFYDDAGTGYVTRGQKWPQRKWHKGVPKFCGPQLDGEPDLSEEEMQDLGPSFYTGPCRRFRLEVQPWQEAFRQR
ncbi:MAG TPA: hypothetical protein VKT32_10650 [Chthonomonadaceae bacterium]|nr:hypothetical protein [Chthonomonadaceae bacterium]